MSDKDVQRLILENAKLKASVIQHCRGCSKLKPHDCGAFWWCPRLGVVNPDIDGCSKRSA